MDPTISDRSDPRARPSVLYACPFNLFDTTSGASMSLRTLLGRLARHGCRVVALQAMVFDAPEGGERVLAAAAAHPGARFIESDVDGVRHVIVRTASTRRREMTGAEEQVYYRRFLRELAERRPDLVLFWGHNPLQRAIVTAAAKAGVPVVFFLVNPHYRSNEAFEGVSLIVTDSDATARLYRERNGMHVVPVGKFIEPGPVKAAERVPREFVFVNPHIPKGVSLFAVLAARARDALPEARFLVVETRGKWEPALRALGYRREDFPNVEIVGPQRDMRRVYGRARALLLPSLWHESGARVITEALINGIPVLATDTGGSAESVADGGFVFPVPAEVCEHPERRVPEAVVEPWLATIARLQRDPDFYKQACARAAAVAAHASIDRSLARFLDAVAPLLGSAAGPSTAVQVRDEAREEE